MSRSVCLIVLASCANHPWVPMLEAMRADRVHIEISTESHDFNRQAPPAVAPSVDNKWLLFFYEPAADAAMHDAFATRLAADCFFAQVVRAVDADDSAAKPSHAAVCVFERVPPVPTEEQPKS